MTPCLFQLYDIFIEKHSYEREKIKKGNRSDNRESVQKFDGLCYNENQNRYTTSDLIREAVVDKLNKIKEDANRKK